MSKFPTAPRADFWQGRRVFVTGHTGFKGSWLSAWLTSLGAQVRGFAQAPATEPSAFAALGLADRLDHEIGEIRDRARLIAAMRAHAPEIVFHLAAQPLVRRSYAEPVETYETNVMGTVNLLEAVRGLASVRAVIVVTSDKCYENREWVWGYRESDPLGGHDPYSSSKACAELVTSAYRASFFSADAPPGRRTIVASVRAGNVVGGGDWSDDRIIPDAMRAFVDGRPVRVRKPEATRPWQHVIDPLRGYLMLAERACEGDASTAVAWNFGPDDGGPVSVASLVTGLARRWGNGADWHPEDEPGSLHEAHSLRLYSTKARSELGWRPRLDLDEALDLVVAWYRAYYREASPDALYRLTVGQIERFGMTP